MAAHFKVYDKHLPDGQTTIARLAMFAQQVYIAQLIRYAG